MSENAQGARSVAPGMEMVIVAGEAYDITDESGQGLALIGKESPWVVEFLAAYDAWRNIARTLGADHEQAIVAYHAVEDKWGDMPSRLVRDLPSYRAGGIIVPGGG